MQDASAWPHRGSGIAIDVLSSMIAELVRHHERNASHEEHGPDWQSPSKRTRIMRFGTPASLYNVVHQVPDAIAAEYQLSHRGKQVFSWREYRWPHLQHDSSGAQQALSTYIPRDCLDELMRYHVQAGTSWLTRYRHRLRCERAAKIDKVDIVAESDRIQ